jgi:hypothetical protein
MWSPRLGSIGCAALVIVVAVGARSQDADLLPAFRTAPAQAARDAYEAAVRQAGDSYWAMMRPAQTDYSAALADALKLAMAAGDTAETALIGRVVQGIAAQLALNADPMAMPRQVPKGTPSQVTWKYGEAPKKLIRVDEGICFLSGIGGNLEGDKESVEIVTREGWWYLQGTSAQRSLWATATCIKFAK